MILYLQLRRFRCRHRACPPHTFVERHPQSGPPPAQRTARLAQALQQLGFTAGGEAGSRVTQQLAMPVSPATLLRLDPHCPPAGPADPARSGRG